ncbi:MAG: SpoIIE family protein phosphatase [Candidatus Riflebacteria bacterium]|nr:SpoIIE family protein phosphatase [Candidatus Riflebacteria bacterium]
MNANLKNLAVWMVQTFVFILIPVLVFYAGMSHIDQLRYEDSLLSVEQKVEETLASFATHSNSEEFLARTFRRAFIEMLAANPTEVIKDYHQRLAGNFDYLLWDASNHLLAGSIDPKSIEGDWRTAIQTISAVFAPRGKHYEPSDYEVINLRKIFGPQLVIEDLSENISESNNLLMATDSSGKKPRCWIASFRGITLVILVEQAAISTSDNGLRYYMQHLHQTGAPFILGFARKDQITSTDAIPDRETASAVLRQHSLKNGLKLVTPQAHYFMRIVDDDLTLFAAVRKDSLAAGSNNITFTIMLILLLAPYLWISWKNAGNGMRFSISRKLLLLFAYSSGLPLSMLFFVGYDYLAQKQYAMFDEIHAQGTKFLKNFDERFKSEEARQIFQISHALEELKEACRNQPIAVEPYKIFADKATADLADRHDLRMFMVASAARFTGTTNAAYINNRRVEITSEKISERTRKKKDEEAEAFTALLRFILSTLNGDQIEARTATEIEMIAESIMQKSLLEVQNEFLQANGQITMMGLGTSRSRALVELISLHTGSKYDFLLMATWNSDVLEQSYARRQFLNASRNIDNLQLGMINENSSLAFPAEFAGNMTLRDYARKFTHRPVPPRQFITINHQDYLIMGFRGKYMSYFNLFGLYPAQLIKDKIYHEKKRLISFGFMSLLLAMLLGQLLSYSFLYPLKILAEGAEAIQLRNFDKRLPELGRDEFGEMARVFNTTMVDFEELKVAGAVQEHLLPGKLPEPEGCRIYARSFSRGDLGGDYYDCFLSSDNRLCLLTGDVSGHGAGAALIMAMAKAAIMKLENLHNAPAELLARMHQLIAATGQHQLKTMSFQFFNIDVNSRQAAYSNAGSWPPLLISHDQKAISEISLPGPRLGALKKPQFTCRELTFGNGETLLLYTDGLIKALDIRGQMIGLENFKKMAVENFHPDPQTFFDRIMAAHRMQTGNRELQDDTTLIIVVFN